MKSVLALLVLLLFAVSAYTQDHNEALEVMESMTAAMTRYAQVVAEGSDVVEVTAANHELAALLEEIGPRLAQIRNQSPELFQDPPDELRDAMTKNMNAQSGFNKALKVALKYANECTDDPAYQESFGRLNRALHGM